MCRKAAKGVSGLHWPHHTVVGEPFSTAAVADSLHAAYYMQHGQNQRWDNIFLTLHNNLENLLPSTVSSAEILEARLSSKPASGGHTHPVPHSSTSLHQYLSTWLNIFSITATQLWTLKESGAHCSLGQGQNFLLFAVEKSCETNSLLQHAVLQILRHSLFNQISTKRLIWTFIQATS
jgi:hypothetical protein